MAGHLPIMNCTFAQFQAAGQVYLLPVMQTQLGNIQAQIQFDDWIWDMWTHYINVNAQWGSCNWFTNRLFGYPASPNSTFIGWVAQMQNMATAGNNTGYAFRRKQAMTSTFRMLCETCGDPCC